MVSFRGFAPTCEEILVGADAYVQPSRFEGSPNALLEAAIMGCPLIASDVQGCREIVAHGETGLLFRSEDPASLAEILDIALDDRERMARIGRHAREIVEARHRPDEIFGQWERVLGLPPDTPGE